MHLIISGLIIYMYMWYKQLKPYYSHLKDYVIYFFSSFDYTNLSRVVVIIQLVMEVACTYIHA